MSFVCVLSCDASDGGPKILLTTDFEGGRPCVSVQCSGPMSVLPYRHLTHGNLGCKFREYKSYMGEGK